MTWSDLEAIVLPQAARTPFARTDEVNGMTKRGGWVLLASATVGLFPGCWLMDRTDRGSIVGEDSSPLTRVPDPSDFSPTAPRDPTSHPDGRQSSSPYNMTISTDEETRSLDQLLQEIKPEEPKSDRDQSTRGSIKYAPSLVDNIQPVQASMPPPPKQDHPLMATLRAYLEQDEQAATRQLEASSLANVELMRTLLPLVVRASRQELDRSRPEEVQARLREYQELTRQLQAHLGLAISKLCFCRKKPEGFGLYDELPWNCSFESGVDGQPGEKVLVYVELKNFASKQRGGTFETAFAGSIELRDLQGRSVAKISFPTVSERTLSLKQDCFVTFQFHVPPHVPPNRYTMWVEVRDVLAQENQARVAKRSLDFRIVEPQSYSRGR